MLTARSVDYTNVDAPPGSAPHLKINDIEIPATSNMDAAALKAYEGRVAAALATVGYPAKFDPAGLNWPVVLLILVIMVIYVTMVYGPIAAFLVELFPTRIRYTSMSLPYHIGNGWFGGMLPLTATALVAANGNIYYGLWYPIVVAAMTFVLGSLFVRETKDHKIGVI
jgi:hypothetical protein